MLDTMLAYLWPEGMAQYTVVGEEAKADPDPNARPDLIFRAEDGYITVGTVSESEWQGFCKAVERPELINDPRFATPAARAAHATARITLMAEAIAARSTADWLARFDANDVPCAPVVPRGEVFRNEQVLARELIQEIEQPTVGRIRQPRPAAEFDRTPSVIQGPAPLIGEHSASILAELGCSPAEIERLAAEKVVRLASA
jgi:crotonobetainyl-CoA:carnitine CoA-transferase CaiB-like acyl-CoA transferase